MHHAFLYIPLPSKHDYDVEMPIFTFFLEDASIRQRLSFSFPALRYSLLEFNSRKKTANIWRIEREGVSVKMFEATRLHFLSDVFVAVAFLMRVQGRLASHADVLRGSSCVPAPVTKPLRTSAWEAIGDAWLYLDKLY